MLGELYIKSDPASKMLNFFEHRIGEEFSKTALKSQYFKESGLSRRDFSKEFDEIMESVAELAASKGYIFKKDTKYGLQDNKISDDVVPIAEILNS